MLVSIESGDTKCRCAAYRSTPSPRLISTLVQGGTAERRDLEYKRDLPGGSDAEKRELLADVSSFANSTGGDILFGVAEENGIPQSLDGVPTSECDGAILRLEQVIRSGLDPRIAGLETAAIPIDPDRSVVCVRVPQSLARPHVVKLGGIFRFYGRGSNGKYPLDLQELRGVFASVANTGDHLANLRRDRLARVTSGETPVPADPSLPKLILHVVPLQAFDAGAQVDFLLAKTGIGTVQWEAIPAQDSFDLRVPRFKVRVSQSEQDDPRDTIGKGPWKPVATPQTDAEQAVAVGLSQGLSPFSPTVSTIKKVEALGPYAARAYEVPLYAVCCLELYNHIVRNAQYRRCANPTCRRIFDRQVGRAVAGQHRGTKVLYCTKYCAAAVASRASRRRRREGR